MGFSTWWVKQTSKISLVRKARAYDEQQKVPQVQSGSEVIPSDTGQTVYKSHHYYSDPTGRIFTSKQAFLSFVEAANASIKKSGVSLDLQFENQNQSGDEPSFETQLERYFASVKTDRAELSLIARSDDHTFKLQIGLAETRTRHPLYEGKTIILAEAKSTDPLAATQNVDAVVMALRQFAQVRPRRGAGARESIVRPMDVHTRELEEFKSAQTRKTFWISTCIAIIGILTSAAVQIAIKLLTQPQSPLPLP